MEYASALEKAKEWGVCLRQVQRLAREGRIFGAKKCGNSWIIPKEALKPADPRGEGKEPPPKYICSGFLLINVPGAKLESWGDSPEARQKQAELAYLRGDFSSVKAYFLSLSEKDETFLCGGAIAMTAAISTGDYGLYLSIEEKLKKLREGTADPNLRFGAELPGALAAVSMFAPALAPRWLREGDFSGVPPEAEETALYLYAKYLQNERRNEAMLAAAETGLFLRFRREEHSPATVYFTLLAADACRALNQKDKARAYLEAVLSYCLPRGLFVPPAEHITALGGLLQEALESRYSAFAAAVYEQVRRTMKNWISFHNRYAQDNITLLLSLREYRVAVLICNGLTYAEAAEELHISKGRLNNILTEIYGKLNVKGKAELRRLIL